MRTIKFRAWDKQRKLMIKTPKIVFGATTKPHVELLRNGFWIDHNVYGDECVLMQYTGLKDKNGKEIYEGDIVKFIFGIQKIYWGVGCWKTTGGEHGHLLNELISRQCEILGHIYENPELYAQKNTKKKN